MKVYVVLKTIVNSNGFSIGSDRIEKIFWQERKAKEYVRSEKDKSAECCYKSIYTISEYDVI